MSHYKPYPAYKDSGVEWLGDVPEHWEKFKLKYIFREKRNISNPDLPAGAISFGRVVEKDSESLAFDTRATYQEVLPGEFLVNPINLNYDLKSLRTALSRLAVCVSPAYIVLAAVHEQCREYLEYLLYRFDVAHMKTLGAGVRQTITFADIGSCECVLPPIKEQIKIAAYLECETTRIDALISKKTRFIELLREKRQALITHAVTKGLDPSVKMKDSGVEWLGEVPEHWEVKPIKWLSPVQRGASPRPIDDPKYFDDDGKHGWVRIEDVTSSGGYLKETKQKLSELGSSLSVKLPIGSLFLSIAGTVGKPCISLVDACIHDGFVYFPLLKISPEWLFRVFECKTPFVGLGKMGTQLNLNTETVGGIFVGLPPAEEIQNILEVMKERLTRIDTIIGRSERSIELLKERRSALITAAVTGQIDLREAA